MGFAGIGIGVLLLLSAACLPLYLSSCGGNGGTSSSGPSYLRGFGLSPEGFPLPADAAHWASFYSEVGGMGRGAAMWNGAWRDDLTGGSDAGTVPAAGPSLMAASAAYGFTPVFVFGWRSGTTLYLNVPDNSANHWANPQARSRFNNMLVNFVAAYRPPYLFLGNENDFYFEQDSADYLNWITFYNSAYDNVKAASPSTLVGPVFQFEHMAGSGGLNGWTTPLWGALTLHDNARMDIVGITVYPWLNFASAASVPAGYLDNLFLRIGSKPVAITETGWPAENLGGLNPSWNTSPQEQVAYIPKFFSAIAGRDVRIVNWTFLHFMVDDGTHSTGWKMFGSISLYDNAAVRRPAYPAWISH
ncbi:MAG: hypothetical protein HZB63_04170 [Deltaproteobacteria bacterium]|nr:hypothetical protein [Deltaproteobacteria bacterium]